jgi:hypothetical protein
MPFRYSFDRRLAVKPAVEGAIYLTHPARAKWRPDFAATESCAGRIGHLVGPEKGASQKGYMFRWVERRNSSLIKLDALDEGASL